MADIEKPEVDPTPSKWQALKLSYRSFRTPILLGFGAVAGAFAWARLHEDVEDAVLDIVESDPS